MNTQKSLFISIPSLLFLIFCLNCSENKFSSNDNLKVLKEEIRNSKNYELLKEKKIANIKDRIKKYDNEENKIRPLWELFTEYRSYQSDSAQTYALKLLDSGRKSNDQKTITLGYIALMDCFNSSGYFKEASDINNLIDTAKISNDIKPFYYDLCYRLYENIDAYTSSSIEEIKEIYKDKRRDYIKTLISSTQPDSYEHQAARIELNRLNDSSLISLMKNRNDLLLRYEPRDHEKAIQYSKIGDAAIESGNSEEALHYMILATIYDLRSATHETTAARKLADILFSMGQDRDAYELIHLAWDDANFYNSQLRRIETVKILPSVDNYHYVRKEKQFKYLGIALTVCGILLLLSIELFYELHLKNMRLKKANEILDLNKKEIISRQEELEKMHREMEETLIKLKETTAIKDDYIMQSLYVNTAYVDLVEEKCKLIVKMIKEGNIKEAKLLQHQFGIREERRRIYQSFDKAFLKLFPNFITEFNRLFSKEYIIEIKKDEELPMEVRIFALIRLGISDSSDIAKYLNLTLNTVYVYKARVKSKSNVDNNEFEKYIMSIPKP